MKTLRGVLATTSILIAGTAIAMPPPLTQEEAREAARKHRGAPYVDLTTCSALDRRAQELAQIQASLDLPAPDRGPATSGGACRVGASTQIVARIDDRYRR